MNSVFGPVLSRRLGRSLGVDPLPFKTCNLSCVYCQLGRTRRRSVGRKEYAPPGKVVEDVRRELSLLGRGTVDWITFVGAGEPTLYSSIGQVIRGIKSLTEIPVAVLTNGSLLTREDVREDLSYADAVLPSFDAGSEDLYRVINRPRSRDTLDSLLGGLMEFRRTYRGILLVEVMIVGGLNDTDEALADLTKTLAGVAPDGLCIGLPTRPPAEPWVKPPTADRLACAVESLSRSAPLARASALGQVTRLPGELVDSLQGVLTRHPMTTREIIGTAAGHRPAEVSAALNELIEQRRVGEVRRFGRRFHHHAGARYGRSAPTPEQGEPWFVC